MGCSIETNNLNSFTGHTSRNHKNHKLRDFQKPVREVNHKFRDFQKPVREVSDFQSNDTDQSCNVEAGFSLASTSCPTLDSTEEDEPDRVQNVDSEILQHKLASLFLRMQCLLHVSKHAIQGIIEECNDILSLSKFHTTEILKEIFAKHDIEVKEEIIQEISNSVFDTNPVLFSTSEEGTLSTDYRRNKYFREHFSIIEPTELLYDQTSKIKKKKKSLC